MKVLMVSGNAPPVICGIGDYSQALSEALRQEGVEVFNVGCRVKPKLSFLKGWSLLWQIRKILSKEKIDVIHLQYEAFSFSQSYALPLYLGTRKISLAVTFHEVFHRTFLEKLRIVFLINRAQVMIVTDQGRLNSLLALTEIHKPIHRWGVGSNLPTLASLGAVSVAPLIGYFGFINAVKNIGTLFESFGIIKTAFPDLRLRLIGQFAEDDLEVLKWKSWTEKNGFSADIEWINSPDALMASRLIHECWVMALPFTDGASIRRGSLQACLSLGKAVVTTAPEPVDTDLQDLYLVSGLDPAHWSKALREVLNDEQTRKKYEKLAFQVSQKFQWPELARRHTDLYRTIAK